MMLHLLEIYYYSQHGQRKDVLRHPHFLSYLNYYHKTYRGADNGNCSVTKITARSSIIVYIFPITTAKRYTQFL